MQQQIDVFIASLTTFWTQLAGFVPQLLAALLLLFIGWLFANLVRTGVTKLLDVLHFDSLAEKTGIEAFLKQGNLDISLSRLLARLAYWIIIFIVIVTVANSLGLHMVADLFNKVVLYIPNIIVAILVLVFGVLVARFINRLVFAYLNNIGVQGALTISTISLPDRLRRARPRLRPGLRPRRPRMGRRRDQEADGEIAPRRTVIAPCWRRSPRRAAPGWPAARRAVAPAAPACRGRACRAR